MSITNVATNTAKIEFQTLADQIAALSTNVTNANAAQYAASMQVLYLQLQDAKRMQLSLLDSANSTKVDALLSQLAAVSSAYQSYTSNPTTANLTNLTASLNAVSSKTASFKAMIAGLSHLWSLQDQVFYQYSKTGEADLNNQLGQLGDALDNLSRVIDVVNKIDLVLSIDPRTDDKGLSKVTTDGTLEADYNTTAIRDLTNVAGSGYTAAQYTFYALQSLKTLSNGFADGTSIKTSINEVITALKAAGIDTDDWKNANDTSGTVWTAATNSFKSFWENQTLRRSIGDLQTTLSSENDIEKQNLRKAMFIYQEFVKSASTVMDRVYDAVKGAASRISR